MSVKTAVLLMLISVNSDRLCMDHLCMNLHILRLESVHFE